MKLPFLVAVGMFFLLSEAVGAATLCVNPGGSGSCYSTIQAAVDAAEKDDVVNVEAGIYTENVTVPESARFTLSGAGSATTIIEGGIRTLDKVRMTIFGFTIQNGSSGIVTGTRSRTTITDVVSTGHHFAGIAIGRRGRAVISDCTMSNNGRYGIRGGSRVEIDRCTLGATGPNVDTVAGVSVSGRLEIRNSTIHDNAGFGVVAKKALIENCTVSGNTDGLGGPQLTVRNATVVGNTDSGLQAYVKKPLVANSLIANNGTDCETPTGVRSLGYNLFEDDTGCGLFGKQTTTDITGLDPMIGPLADNGGPTQTHALLGGSPAIGTGGPLDGGPKKGRCLPLDQRGTPRGGACDIGAYEKAGG